VIEMAKYNTGFPPLSKRSFLLCFFTVGPKQALSCTSTTVYLASSVL
jgi:hypothetical protein